MKFAAAFLWFIALVQVALVPSLLASARTAAELAALNRRKLQELREGGVQPSPEKRPVVVAGFERNAQAFEDAARRAKYYAWTCSGAAVACVVLGVVLWRRPARKSLTATKFASEAPRVDATKRA
jgi:hypothetical protein